MIPRRQFLRAAGVALLGLGGCAPGRSDARLEPLRIAFVPQIDMEERYAGAYVALQAYLEPRLDRPVEIFGLENANASIEAMRAGKIDLCNFSPWPFLMAEQRAGLTALLITKAPDGGPRSYRSLLVSHPTSGIKTAEDLVRRSRELVFAFEEPVSTSGHFAPRVFLHSLGLRPESDFKQLIYGTDGITNLLAAKAGRVDVAALSDTAFQRAVERGRLTRDEIVIVWESPPILSTVIAVRGSLPVDLRARLQTLLIELPAQDPVHWRDVARQYSSPVTGYLPVAPTALDYFRQAIRDIPGLQHAA